MTDNDLLAALKESGCVIIDDKPYVQATTLRVEQQDSTLTFKFMQNDVMIWRSDPVKLDNNATINITSDFFMKAHYSSL